MSYSDVITKTEEYLEQSTYHDINWSYRHYKNHYQDPSAIDDTGIRQIIDLAELLKDQRKDQRRDVWALRAGVLVLALLLVYTTLTCL